MDMQTSRSTTAFSSGPESAEASTPDRPYWESTTPGAGRRMPRADATGDAAVLSLNGQWRFRLWPTAAGTGVAFLSAEFDDSTWDAMPVPSHWVLEEFTPLAGGAARRMLGTEEGPLYTNTAYPIPLDPPRVSTENPTGDYRLVFDVAADFGPAVLRFQGVDSCAKVWLNGEELGWSTGSRLPFEFDAPVRAGRNVLCVRVHRWSAGTYLEDQDMWWLPGIFRDVELLSRPAGAIDDHFVHADYDAATGVGTLRVDASTDAVVEIPELGIRMSAGETATVDVEPWSADRPRLYRGTLRSSGETIELAVGFRRVEIVDGVFTVNGRPVTFRGVNRHEHHPDTGRALDRDTMIQDIVMMKRANIDAVRTSHYPPHPEFLRLCDEYGLWVVVEVDLETHGFIYEGWAHNPPALPEWREALMDRLRRTVERDKNRPSVVVWSLANESMTGDGFGDMRRWLDERDPSRAVLYERDPSYRDSDLYSLMYPSLELLEQIGRREEPRGGRLSMHGMVFGEGDAVAPLPDGVTEADEERRRGLPFLLVEYAHAMGNGPGSLQDYWRIINGHQRLCGAFVWEWIDHGFHAVTADGVPFVMHGDDVEYEPRGGRFSLHGLVFSDRTPTPGLVELAKAHEPVSMKFDDRRVYITNNRHCADTSDLVFRWSVEAAGETVASGVLPAQTVASGEALGVEIPDAATAALADPDASGAGEIVLTVEAALAAEALWAPAGHVIAWAQRFASAAVAGGTAPAPLGGELPSPRETPATVVAGPPGGVRAADERRSEDDGTAAADRGSAIPLGAGRFDAETGRLVRLGDLEIDGPVLDLYRAPTENDQGQGDLNNVAAVWRKTMLHRLLHRVDAVAAGDGRLRVTGRTAPRTHPHGVDWTMTWTPDGDGLLLDVEVDFVGPWADTPYMHRDIRVPRLGLLFGLPGAAERVTWFGRGPGETYADSYEGSRVGRFERSIDDLQVPYPVPQENGNHVQTRRLEVAGPGIPSLRVEGRPHFDFTARRWTSHDLDGAAKPHQLVDAGRVWLNIDHAQQGLGSASVGPALPERYRIARERTAWSVRLESR
ncbi:glycoside hydrolase family 2 TIM barrel-domain containing protein [Microbacterium sp. B35-30]|uniref:glycoside hydrolase family 2 TIM barrel-domain containing protein n=1 Tax=Microbacterium sp. B35-30 TaxID=1962642 RepID=UPI001EF99482|nr:glycoside hydrolase family 2 TIM barrel-domain containing protein [Microbacterium sp. B35-30]